jgi:hypothetical protein
VAFRAAFGAAFGRVVARHLGEAFGAAFGRVVALNLGAAFLAAFGAGDGIFLGGFVRVGGEVSSVGRSECGAGCLEGIAEFLALGEGAGLALFGFG